MEGTETVQGAFIQAVGERGDVDDLQVYNGASGLEAIYGGGVAKDLEREGRILYLLRGREG